MAAGCPNDGWFGQRAWTYNTGNAGNTTGATTATCDISFDTDALSVWATETDASNSIYYEDEYGDRWYCFERIEPEPEKSPWLPELPLWDLLPLPAQDQRWSPKDSVRDSRKSVWACRPRHGLSGR